MSSTVRPCGGFSRVLISLVLLFAAGDLAAEEPLTCGRLLGGYLQGHLRKFVEKLPSMPDAVSAVVRTKVGGGVAYTFVLDAAGKKAELEKLHNWLQGVDQTHFSGSKPRRETVGPVLRLFCEASACFYAWRATQGDPLLYGALAYYMGRKAILGVPRTLPPESEVHAGDDLEIYGLIAGQILAYEEDQMQKEQLDGYPSDVVLIQFVVTERYGPTFVNRLKRRLNMFWAVSVDKSFEDSFKD